MINRGALPPSPSESPTPSAPSWAALVAAAACAVLVCPTGAELIQLGLGFIDRVAPSWVPAPPLGSGGFFGAHTILAWVAGALPLAVLLAAYLLGGRRAALAPWLRAVLALVAAGALVLLVTAALAPIEVPDPAAFHARVPFLAIAGLGALSAAALATGLVRPLVLGTRPARRALVLGTLLSVIALGIPTYVETWREYRPESLASFQLELVAAYPFDPERTGAVVIDPTGSPGSVITFAGQRFNLHRGNRLSLAPGEVRRVRWVEGDGDGSPLLAIRLSGPAAARLRARSMARMSQFDALLIDGDVMSVPLHEDVMDHRLFLVDSDRARLARLYHRLVGRNP